jgi:ubiquinone/menaquinone biosynthesis C-methylase UbiE
MGLFGSIIRDNISLMLTLDKSFWERYFSVYDVLNHAGPYQSLLSTVCEELSVENGEKILEAGCGTGNLAMKLKERGGDVYGLDSSEAAVEIYRSKDPSAKTVLADLRDNLPFPDGYFDKIASNNALYALPENLQPLCVKEFYRVLKPGGKVVISNPKQGWSALVIYGNTIISEIKVNGPFKAIGKIIKMMLPTIKIFYYNHLIRKETRYHFFEVGEQKRLLEESGFVGYYEKLVYAEQAILVGAFKPS